MKRRGLLRFGLLAGAAGLVTTRMAHAEPAAAQADRAGGVYLTEENPGRWRRKINSHLPLIEATTVGQKTEVLVTTRHAFTGYRHYIIKHVLLDEYYRFLDEHFFDPETDDKAVSRFQLEEIYQGVVHALSVCNRHDVWLASHRMP